MTIEHKDVPENLIELQKNFKDYLFTAEIGFAQFAGQPPQGQAKERLEVYSDGYRLRLLEVFSTHYPIMQTVLGAHDFQQLGLRYLAENPSNYANIRFFGDRLADYLLQQSDSYHPALTELATLEWALSSAVDAADAPIVTSEKIGQLQPEEWAQIHLNLHPSVQLLHQEWNVTEVWLEAKEARSIPEWCQYEQASPCLVWRQDNGAYYQNIDSVDAYIITRYQQEAGFEQICDELLEQGLSEDDIPHCMAHVLQFLLAHSAISAITLSES